jgi:16S rRNA (uracil1498-N3)-methyltransferase
MSQRFYCPAPPADGHYRLDADEARHLTRVCRKGPGDVVTLFDGRGFATLARIVEVARVSARLTPEGGPLADREAACRVEVATAAPKGDRFDWLVEKAVEVGVARVVPLATGRSVVDPRGSKLERLRRTIVEASKQCGRARLMDLAPPEDLADYLARADGVRLLADPAGEPPHAWPTIAAGSTVRLVVGPEGGLTDEEVERARAEGWRPVRFAAAILRVETAAVAGAAAILARVQPTH